MAILKKPEPKKHACKCGDIPRSIMPSGVAALSGAARTLGPSPEEFAQRAQMNHVQLNMMKADLRKHVAEADLAEIIAARALADFEELKAARKVQPAHR